MLSVRSAWTDNTSNSPLTPHPPKKNLSLSVDCATSGTEYTSARVGTAPTVSLSTRITPRTQWSGNTYSLVLVWMHAHALYAWWDPFTAAATQLFPLIALLGLQLGICTTWSKSSTATRSTNEKFIQSFDSTCIVTGMKRSLSFACKALPCCLPGEHYCAGVKRMEMSALLVK